jgi:predicted NBD/HSP70 family sugar kinase
VAVEPIVYAIDIGDSLIRAGVFQNGRTLLTAQTVTPKEDFGIKAIDSALWPIVAGLVHELQSTHPGGVGLALSASGTMTLLSKPGLRDYGAFRDDEVIVFAPNVDGLKHAPILSCVERLDLGLPLHIENDMNAALTSAVQFDEAILIGLGAGLGAAIKKNGRIEHLPGTWSCFEIGHGKRWNFGRDHFNRKCNCGTVGCLEAAIGGWAMAERYVMLPETATPVVYERMREDVIALLPQAIARLADASRIPTILMAGKGSLGYATGSDFIARLQAQTQRMVRDLEIEVQLIDLGEAAELQGAALAFLDHVEPTHYTLDLRGSDVQVTAS